MIQLSHKPLSGEDILSKQVKWQHPTVVKAGIDQTRLAIADAPTDGTPFSFLVMGDTDAGSSSGSPEASFANAFADQLMAQFQQSRFVLHTGDVTYPIGTYQNYFDGFLQPYQALLSQLPQRPLYRGEPLLFNRPLLPVPGNHDYAELHGGDRLRERFLQFVCNRLRQVLNVDWGHYGGQGGEAYGQAFLDHLADFTPEQLKAHLVKHYNASVPHSPQQRCLSYRSGAFTRLPNRYYAFCYGGVDFFALDSNTWNRSPEAEGFDLKQLAWLEKALTDSWQTPETVGRIVYFHHAAYTTEETRWQNSETLWVRRHFRNVLDRVADALSERPKAPLVDLVISGHAHCLEHVQTADTGHADAHVDWLVCGGSGAGLRRQRSHGPDILENVLKNDLDQRQHRTKVVARSQFYVGIHGHDKKKQHFHSFVRISIDSRKTPKIEVQPFIVVYSHHQWQTKTLAPIGIGGNVRNISKVDA